MALSHGVGPRRGDNSELAAQEMQLANGIVLAVRATYAGVWEQVQKDKDGRGLAANLVCKAGITVFVVGVYEVTGGSLPDFEGQRCRVDANQRLRTFLQKQLQLAAASNWLLVVSGDLNSIIDPALDTWGGAARGAIGQPCAHAA